MKRILPLLALLALPAAGALPHPAAYEFDYAAKLTVSGYAGSSALSGFPVLVRIEEGSPSGFSYDQLKSKSTGADLVFVDMDGNGLPFEIDTWDATGTSLVWVKLPSMSAGTEFAMCWGSDTSGKTVCGTNPFADYVGVWHMSEASGTVADSSGHSLAATPAGAAASTASIAVSGAVGNGRQCGTSTDASGCAYLSIPSYDSQNVGNTFAVSGWVSVSASQAGVADARLFSRKADYQNTHGWEVIWKKANDFCVRGASGNNIINYTPSPTFAGAGWKHIFVVYEGNKATIYEDGVQKKSASGGAAPTDNGKTLSIGAYSDNNGSQLVGSVDECRLLDAVPTGDWAKAEYDSMANAAFLTVGAAEFLGELPEPTASLAVGSVQVSNAVATVTVDRLGIDATSADVTVQVSADASFGTFTALPTYSVSGPGASSVSITGLSPFTTYYARAVVANNRNNSVTTAVASFKTKRAPSNPSDKIIAGLEDYGALTLVDEIDCSLSLADDPDHRFREYPSGWSKVEDILDVPTRTMAHKSDTCCYVSWRVGEGKGIVPNEPYILVVDYPDEAPRSVTLFNFGNGTRHGYHTGFTVGDSMSPPYVTQSLESWAIPFSGETKQLVQVMIPYEKSTQYNGGSRIDMATEGFDVNFGLIKANEAPDSIGLAVSAIRLYKIDSYDVARPAYPYPAEGLPRRLVTSREEMGDSTDWDSFSTPSDFYKGRAKMIRLLGMNGCSKDMLEFGYMQNWDTFGRGWKWGYATDHWTKSVEYLGLEDIDILPFYEYHGSRGSGGIGYNKDLMPWTLESASYPDRKYHFSNQLTYVSNCMADLTNDETLWDLEELFRLTVLNLSDKAHFRGMWLRNRGAMPMGFNDHAISLFNEDTGRTAAGTAVTRGQIYNNGRYTGTDLYKEYRTWWYGKRRDLFARLQSYMASNLDGAVLYYSNTIEEPGEFWAGWRNPRPALLSNEEGYTYQGKNFNEFSGAGFSTSIGAAAGQYWPNALNADCPTWDPYEVNHSAPADDPHNYTNLNGVALCYPFNTVWTVADKTASARYRTAGGDLPFVRHYSLNENDFKNASGQEICGYYTCDWDHAGRAVMLSELYAMAYDDPTMLGYLFTANLVRNDSTYVREFNLNYLSLPALKGEVLVGGGWPDTFTVRRWVTDKGTYWAVINCDSKPWSGQVDFRTDRTEIWYTVSGQALPLSGGKATLSLEPFQMLCFKDVEPEHVETPIFRYAFAEDVEAKTATLVANLPDLGYGATGATVHWTLSGGSADVSSGTFPAFTTHGAQSVAVSGLQADTLYTISLTAVNDKGKSATTEFNFRTAVWPFVFNEPTAVTDANGTRATATVKLSRANVAGTLSLVVDGTTVRTWDNPVAGQAYSAGFDVALGVSKRYKFVVVDPGALYGTEVEGRVTGRKTVGWFDIAFDDGRYTSWTLGNVADPAIGGTWSKSGDGNESTFVSSGNRRIDLSTGESGFVRYVPSPASQEGCRVKVSGRTELVAEYGVPPALSPSPLAALALGREGVAVTLYGWTADGWVALTGVKVASPCWIDWFAEFDFAAGTVTYSAADPATPYAVGDPVYPLSSDGRSALPLGGSKTQVTSVTYVGNGAVDDFDGVYYIEEKSTGKLVSFDAVVKPGRAGIWFANAGTDTENFVIGLAQAETGQWYAAFGCPTLSTNLSEWVCVSCEKATNSVVDLPASTKNRPAQFFRIYRATEDVFGLSLADLLDEGD